MKRALALLVLFVLWASPGFAADDVVSKAMKLYEKRHYPEAASELQAELLTMDQGRQPAAYLTLGMIYLKNAELHRALYQASLSVHLSYLQKLAAARGKTRSRFVDFFMGEVLLEAGKPGPALNHLEKFAALDRLEPRYAAAARVAIGLCYSLENKRDKADESWAGLDKSDPEIKAALAHAYLQAGLKDRNEIALVDESLADLRKAGKTPSLRHMKSAIAVYTAAGLLDKGLETAGKADLRAYSYQESLNKSKIIRFYDVSLLNALSSLYLRGSIAALEKASQDRKLGETAGFYLGQAYALNGSIDQSIKATATFIGSSTMPQQYKDKAMVRQAGNQYQKGKKFDAIGKWDELSKKQPEDVDVIAEILFVCGSLSVDCPKVAQKAAAAAENGEGKAFANLNIALGRYYLARRNYAKTVSYLETGRDKGNKNKIESNDPVMLVSLAEAYYKTKKFSEALEIYFEMSKHYPEVRQIQEALQGVYAMEHKSAGDVKIF